MPNPIATYKTLRFLWDESKPVRDWLWARLPSVQDRKKKEAVEDKLAKLLDDANDLSQALPASELDSHIERRIDQFRLDLSNAGLEPAEVDALAERAALFVKMLVTGPLGDIVSLRKRLAEMEAEIGEYGRSLEAVDRRLRATESELAKAAEALEHNRRQQISGLIGLVAILLALIAYYVATR